MVTRQTIQWVIWVWAAAQLLKQATAGVLVCSTLHPACVSCSIVTASGGVSVVCNQCSGRGYVVGSKSRQTCDCAPGFYSSTSLGATGSSSSTACVQCYKGSFCPGGPAQAAASHSCGPCLTTASTGATSAAACITKPGCGYMSGVNNATQCPIGSFNEGSNRRDCTPCPVGMSTAGLGATAFGNCTAKRGWRWWGSGRAALPCPQGTYKAALSNTAGCTRCSNGSTTRSIHSNAASDCSVALPGHFITWQDAATPIATPCPLGTFSPGYSSDSTCRSCPYNLSTPAVGATSAAQCSAPPGYGFSCAAVNASASGELQGAASTNTNTTTNTTPDQQQGRQVQGSSSCVVQECPAGNFKEGWGRSACMPCGANFKGPPGATSAQQCFIPAGWGSTPSRDGSGLLVARRCLQGLVGASAAVYGNTRRSPCQPCPAHMVTPDMVPNNSSLTGPAAAAAAEGFVFSSLNVCLTMPGYGMVNGSAVRCPKGHYCPGYSRTAPQPCGTGMTTVSTGATAQSDCVTLPGWQLLADGSAQLCPIGSYSPGLRQGPCLSCGLGLTTASEGATAQGDCIALPQVVPLAQQPLG